MTLLDVIRHLASFHGEKLTIYVTEPWTPDSSALLADQEDDLGNSAEAAKAGMTYFMEVSTAQEFLESWLEPLAEKPSPKEQCEVLIHFALYDA